MKPKKNMFKKFDTIFEDLYKNKSKIEFNNTDIAKELIVQFILANEKNNKYYCELYNQSAYGYADPEQIPKRTFISKIENFFAKHHIHFVYRFIRKFVKDFILLIKSLFNCTIGIFINVIKLLTRRL